MDEFDGLYLRAEELRDINNIVYNELQELRAKYKENRKLQEENRKLQEENRLLRSENEGLRRENEEMEIEDDHLRTQWRYQNGEYERLKDAYKHKEIEINKLKTNLSELKTNLSNKDIEIDNLRHENEAMVGKISLLEVDGERLTDVLRATRSQPEHMEVEINELKTNLSELKTNLSDKDIEIDDLKSQRFRDHIEIDRRKRTTRRICKQVVKMLKKNTGLKKEHAKLIIKIPKQIEKKLWG